MAQGELIKYELIFKMNTFGFNEVMDSAMYLTKRKVIRRKYFTLRARCILAVFSQDFLPYITTIYTFTMRYSVKFRQDSSSKKISKRIFVLLIYQTYALVLILTNHSDFIHSYHTSSVTLHVHSVQFDFYFWHRSTLWEFIFTSSSWKDSNLRFKDHELMSRASYH